MMGLIVDNAKHMEACNEIGELLKNRGYNFAEIIAILELVKMQFVQESIINAMADAEEAEKAVIV